MILSRYFVFLLSASVLSNTALGALPELDLPSTITILDGAPLHLPLNGFDADGDPLTFSVSVSDPSRIETFIPSGNRSLELNVSGFGAMVFEMFEQRAPRTTGRIFDLAESGFYDGVTFHRVIDEFVIQGGDPTGTGSGGSTLGDFDDEFHPDLLHSSKGMLSMAKAGDDTNDSQFFVTDVATSFLDFNHSVFGILTDGEAVRDAISNVATTNATQRPLEPVVIDSARIFDDTENGVLMLKALQSTTEITQVEVTASDGTDSVTKIIDVLVEADAYDHPPYLNDIGAMTAPLNEEFTFAVSSFDLEGDAVDYQIATDVVGATVDIDSSGLARFAPPEGFQGEARFIVRVFDPSRPSISRSDQQLFSINVVPEPGAACLSLLGGIAALGGLRRRRSALVVSDRA